MSQAAVLSCGASALRAVSHVCKRCLQELKLLHNPAVLLVAAYFPRDLVFFFFSF